MQRMWRVKAVLLLLVLGAAGTALGLRAVAQQSPTPAEDDADSAQTIEDDPVVAPDSAESADFDLTFPVDI